MVLLIAFLVSIFANGVLVALVRRSGSYVGQMVIQETNDGITRFTLEIDGDPDELRSKAMIRFKVTNAPTQEDIRE